MLPVEPLVAAMPEHQRGQPNRWLRIGGDRWKHYVAHGLSVEYADRLAVRIGKHPQEIWGDAVWSDLPEWTPRERVSA